MNNEQLKIGVLGSTQTIIDRINTLNIKDIDLIVSEAKGLEDAIPVAIKMQQSGFDVLISRRGTASLLRENLVIPVLSFTDRSIDILESLKNASTMGQRILLPAFRQKIKGLSIIEDLLDIHLTQTVYHNRATIKDGMLQAKADGCEIVVGGIVTQQLASEIGLKYVELRTSDADITSTIENAKSVALSAREEKKSVKFYRSIIDSASEGIIAVDSNGTIQTINATAKEWIKADEDSILGRKINQVISNCPVPKVLTTQKPLYDRINKIRQKHFLFNYHPVMLKESAIGVIATFRHIDQVMRSENVVRRSFARGLVSRYTFDDLVHESPAISEAINYARQYAKTDSTILIVGETGTGKEIFSHGVHYSSKRFKHPFVSINCAAIPEQLLESELFGYEEGAFTGSKKGGKPGLFEIAHQGSIYLDEIESTPHSVQLKLLRVLQEREVMRIGGNRKIPVNVRIIASSNRNLNAAVAEGSFREDLFFRINILQIQIPPLRQRREDIPILLKFFIGVLSESRGIDPFEIPKSFMNNLYGYSWPGNVRQLRNFAERLVMNYSINKSMKTIETLIHELNEYPAFKSKTVQPSNHFISLREQVKHNAESNEKNIISDALQKTRFNRSEAAKILGISRGTLWRKIKQLNIEL